MVDVSFTVGPSPFDEGQTFTASGVIEGTPLPNNPNVLQVTDVTGTAQGDLTITGVGTSGDNLLYAPNDGPAPDTQLDQQGISFIANGQSYNLHAQIATSHEGNSSLVSYGESGPNGSVPIDFSAPFCFATGTAIRTARGDIAVEALAVGDLPITSSGALRPIRWIGSRTIAHPTFERCPVRIRAGAFGANLPERDLFLSPGHPVLVGADADNEGGHLVPIMCLVNGTTIARHPVESVTYWHVELDAHDILLAEGLPAESYIDLGSRPWFAGADGALFDPDFVLPGMPGRCRPVAVDGPVVEGERRRLDAVFAMALATQCGWDHEPVLAS